MRGIHSCFLFVFITFYFFACQQNAGEQGIHEIPSKAITFDPIPVNYPETYYDSTEVDTFYNVRIRDPYRWLEYNSPSTKHWVQEQQEVSENYLEQVPYREAIKKRVAELWNFERLSVLQKVGDQYYFFKNDGLKNQDVLYRTINLKEKPQMVLDPNTFSTDGTKSLGKISFSSNGKYLAYQVSEGGSDWKYIKVLNLETGRVMRDEINWVKFSGIAWLKDGFYYSRYPEPNAGEQLSSSNEFHQVYYHQLGTEQSEDELIFADRYNAKRNIYASTTEDERFLILSISASTSGNALYFQDLKDENAYFTPITAAFDHDFEVIGSIKNHLLIKTNHKAPNQRLIKVSISNPEEPYWEEIIAESDDVLQSAHLSNGQILAKYIHNASNQLKIFDTEGTLVKEVKMPTMGTVEGIESKVTSAEAFLSFTSFLSPSSIYAIDMNEYNITAVHKPQLAFDASPYEIKQIRYESYDGTSIPMYIIHKRGIELDGNHPTLLYGYGGFDIPILPRFNRTSLNLFPIILENGGVCAVANIRGGGEFGSKWHKSGTLTQKQNVFDDFQAAAEYLIANQYTSAKKLAIYGRSNGGLLVGACMTQRPDLYQVAIPAVGVLDMLRYHQFTIGWAWASDYGTVDNSKEFDYLFAYSPLHNVSYEKYPATLITTAERDDRVVPAHSYKFAATLQKKQRGKAPIVTRIDKNAGHGAGRSTQQKINEAADVLSFIFYNMKEKVIY
ncbi:MAG: prolyl oligopeptidase family serine peptidase [Saprospiraceae bacterium]|jgi:prolyl oligopeptidase|nr:prolyl oligopeptidase family serine peptidase [Saprospiraceae bacterium]